MQKRNKEKLSWEYFVFGIRLPPYKLYINIIFIQKNLLTVLIQLIKSHYCHTSQKINIQDIHTSSCTIKHTQRFPAYYHSPARHCTFPSSVSRRAHHIISNKDLSYSSTTFFSFLFFSFYFRYSYMIKININTSRLFPIQEINK